MSEQRRSRSVFKRIAARWLLPWVVVSVVGSSSADAQQQGCRPPVGQVNIGQLGPIVLYTDIQSGPTTSGENDLGVYLSIFGSRFWSGSSGISPVEKGRIKVFVGGQEVAAYRYFGVSQGRPDIQQITVQVGRLRGSVQSRPLPVVVEVAGRRSSDDTTFLPNPGHIYFVDNIYGDDSTGVAGDVRHPFRHVQTHDPLSGGVWPLVGPGDFIVMRGRGKAWQDTGVDGYFVRFEKSGLAPAGRVRTGPISLMSYPGEDVFINETYSISTRGAIAGINGPHGRVVHSDAASSSRPERDRHLNRCEQNPMLQCSQWVNVVGLRIEGGGDDGAVNLEIGGNHWRVINNRLSAATARETARSGGVTGDGLDAVILGNRVEEINSPDPGLQNHGIYIDGPGSYRIQYNYIHNVRDGSGFQVYGDETATGSFTTSNLVFSHNWIDHVAKYCINLADHAGSSFSIFDNVSAFCGLAGVRLNSSSLQETLIYNNTFYRTNSLRKPDYGAIVIDTELRPGALDVRNNLFVPEAGTAYMGGDHALFRNDASAHFADNQYFNGTGMHAFDPGSITADPLFSDAEHCDFHPKTSGKIARGDSPAVNALVHDDFEFLPYEVEHSDDIGAYGHHGK